MGRQLMNDNEQLQCAADVRREAMEEPGERYDHHSCNQRIHELEAAAGEHEDCREVFHTQRERIRTLEAALREILKPQQLHRIVLDIARAALAGEPKCQECGGSGEIEVHHRPLTSNNFESSSMEHCSSCGGDA